MRKIIVAIDGHAATGKSSQSKRLADALGYTYIDTGAMYRAVTYFALKQNSEGRTDPKRLLADLDQIKIQFRYTLKGQQTFLNGKEISKAIREADVTAQVSQVAKLPEVRSFLVIQQQAMGVNKGIVMDGRDLGTVVFPEAECKFFLTARPEIRAKRRHLEQLEQGNKQAFESVLANLKERDYLDSNRTTSPMVRAEDAIEIDVSDASIDEVYEVLWSHISEKIAL